MKRLFSYWLEGGVRMNPGFLQKSNDSCKYYCCAELTCGFFLEKRNFMIMDKDLILRERLAVQRTILANQTTFLAFLRTSMYFLVAGVSINSLIDIREGLFIEIAFIVVSALLLLIGILNFSIHKRKIKESEKHIGDYKIEFLDEE